MSKDGSSATKKDLEKFKRELTEKIVDTRQERAIVSKTLSNHEDQITKMNYHGRSPRYPQSVSWQTLTYHPPSLDKR